MASVDYNVSNAVDVLNAFEKESNSDVRQIELKEYNYGCWKDAKLRMNGRRGVFRVSFDNNFTYVPRPWSKSNKKGIVTSVAEPVGKTEVTPPPLVKLLGKSVKPFKIGTSVRKHKVYVKNGKYYVSSDTYSHYEAEPQTINVGLSDRVDPMYGRYPSWIQQEHTSKYLPKRIKVHKGVPLGFVYSNYEKHNSDFYDIIKDIVTDALIHKRKL